MSSDTNALSKDDSRAGGGFWKGVVVGIAVVLLILALIAAAGFLMMGRCPMCGRMMEDGMMQDGMLENDMMDGVR
ncbi:MAG: hypothetical protein WD851_15995 [Pirellulales bacterium]